MKIILHLLPHLFSLKCFEFFFFPFWFLDGNKKLLNDSLLFLFLVNYFLLVFQALSLSLSIFVELDNLVVVEAKEEKDSIDLSLFLLYQRVPGDSAFQDESLFVVVFFVFIELVGPDQVKFNNLDRNIYLDPHQVVLIGN